jgi:hypothetical protein
MGYPASRTLGIVRRSQSWPRAAVLSMAGSVTARCALQATSDKPFKLQPLVTTVAAPDWGALPTRNLRPWLQP